MFMAKVAFYSAGDRRFLEKLSSRETGLLEFAQKRLETPAGIKLAQNRVINRFAGQFLQ